MRIQYKLTFVEVVITIGFAVAIGVSLYFTNFAVSLKNVEYQVNEISSSMEKLNYSAQTFLSTAENIVTLRDNFQSNVAGFEKQLNILSREKGTKFLGKRSIKGYRDVVGWWKQLKDWYISPEIKYLDEMIANGFAQEIGNEGIQHAYLQHQDEASDLIGKVLTLQNYQDNVMAMAATFNTKLNAFVKNVSTESEKTLQNSYILVIVIVILSIILSIIIVNIIAWRISMRISIVEDAIKTVSRGDFSRELNIKSGDEFEELSHHYNAFKTELWKKLDSVLEFMIDVSVSLSEGLDIKRALEKILQSIMKNSNVDAGAVFMIDEDSPVIRLQAVEGQFPCPFKVPEVVLETPERQLDFLREYKITPGKTIIGAVMQSGEGVYIRNSAGNEYLVQNSDKNSSQYIRSMIIVPLVVTRRVLGAIALVKTNPEEEFTDVDFANMKTFGDYAALTIDNLYNFTEAVQKTEMERELKIAANIQSKLLPAKLPDITNFSIGVFSQAAEAVSSDYYDVFKLPGGRTAVVLCDVVGKGIPAALLMVMIRTMIRIVAPSAKDSDHLLRIINKGLRKKIGVDQYATMSVLFLNEKTGKISYSNAAHAPLLYYAASGNRFSQIDTPGLPIGVEPDEQYSKELLSTSRGDLFFLYTDGIMDAQNGQGETYSLGRLEKLIKGKTKLNGQAIADAVLSDITSFMDGTPRIDDQTMLVLKLN